MSAAHSVPTAGTLVRRGSFWIVGCEPQVMMRLKRVFSKVDKASADEARIRRSDEVDRELQWFLDRFPMEISDEDRAELHRGAERHRDLARSVRQLLSADYAPREFALAVPPRDYQRVAADWWLRTGNLLLGDDTGVGKQQPVDTNVLTPDGWRRIGDLVVGDYVIGSTGKAVRVLAIYPQGVKPSYRLTFTDGSSVQAGPEHLWTMFYWCGGRRLAPLVLTTDELRLRPVREESGRRLRLAGLRFLLPMLSSPAEFTPASPLPIDPYLTGQLIANGCLHSGGPKLVTGAHNWPDVLAMLERRGTPPSTIHTYGSAVHATFTKLKPSIRALGLDVPSPAKRIPTCYLRAMPADRIALLHGLMDGDGTASRNGNRIAYCSTSEGLAADVRELVEGLGGMASVRGHERAHENKPTDYHVRIRLPASIAPFTVTSKLGRCSTGTKQTHPVRSLVSVDYVRDVESVCIAVDAPDALYCTEHAILTHNTISAIAGLSDPSARPALVVTPGGAVPLQWAEAIERVLPSARVHILKTTTPYDVALATSKEYRRRGRTSMGFPDILICPYSRLAGWADAVRDRVVSVVYDEAQELRHSKTGGNNEEPKLSQKWAAANRISTTPTVTRRLGLSATPTVNYGAEIWNVMECIAPGALGERREFDREWCTAGDEERKRKLRDPRAFGLYLREAGFMLRRTRKDVGREMPQVTIVPQHLEADLDALRNVSASVAELARTILASNGGKEAWREKGNASASLDRIMRQATGIAKAPYIAAFIRMLVESGERVVVGLWHREVYRIIGDKLRDLAPAFYTGEESDRQKAEALTRFKKGETPVLCMSLRSGAALDGLQYVCRTVVIGELDWSNVIHHQLISRVDRDGQPDKVVAYYLLADAGSDPTVAEVCGAKSANSEPIRNPDKVVADVKVDPEHIRKLASAVLARKA